MEGSRGNVSHRLAAASAFLPWRRHCAGPRGARRKSGLFNADRIRRQKEVEGPQGLGAVAPMKSYPALA